MIARETTFFNVSKVIVVKKRNYKDHNPMIMILIISFPKPKLNLKRTTTIDLKRTIY